MAIIPTCWYGAGIGLPTSDHWKDRPIGSRWAPHPYWLASVQRNVLGSRGWMGIPWMNQLVFIYHFKWNLIILLIVTWWSKGRMWGFQTNNRHICRGRKCSLPRRIKSAAALSLPKRERKVCAKTRVWERIVLMVRVFIRFAGTLAIFFRVRNSIPIKVNSCVGIKSDFLRFGMKPRFCTFWRVYFVWKISRLPIRSLISQSARYGKRGMARSRKCTAITFINFVKIHGLRDIPNGKAVNWKTWCS